MKAYRILIYEGAGEPPMELAAELVHDARARQFAGQKLAESRQVSAVEVWSGRSLIARFTDASTLAAA